MHRFSFFLIMLTLAMPTFAQQGSQISDQPNQILIDACKALLDLQKKSDCLESILRMGQQVSTPTSQSQPNTKELEELYSSISIIVASIKSGTQWREADEKINFALAIKSRLSPGNYNVDDKLFHDDLLKILDSCEDFKYISRWRFNNSDYSGQKESSKDYKIAIKYKMEPGEINQVGFLTFNFRWYSVVTRIRDSIVRDFEIATYKRKNK